MPTPAPTPYAGENGILLFVSNRLGNFDVYVSFISFAGSSATFNLSSNPAWDADPAWSPDFRRIAFASDRDGNFDIWVMNADGSNQINLTHSLAEDRFPQWSHLAGLETRARHYLHRRAA